MKLTLIFSALIAACCVHAAELNTLTDKEKADGWTLLFNGKDLTGWRAFAKQTPPGPGWKVEDGILKKLAKQRGGDIVTEQKFNDYEFSWEWLVKPGANNGVKYMVSEQRKNSPGPEYQLIDDKGAKDTLTPKHLTATFYDVLPRQVDTAIKPADTWNSSRIIVKGNHVEHWLNGTKVLEFELGSDAVKQAVAKSKFAKVNPPFSEKVAGHILLTDHGDEAWFRNLKIRELR
jgi:hypothetical protein